MRREHRDRAVAGTRGARARKLHSLRVRRLTEHSWVAVCACGWRVTAASRVEAEAEHRSHVVATARHTDLHEPAEFRRDKAHSGLWHLACRCGWAEVVRGGRSDASRRWSAHRQAEGAT
jgi:hypothetical protein